MGNQTQSVQPTISKIKWPRGKKYTNYKKSDKKKCTETGNGISEALLHLRATPIDSHTKSPAELMFKRQLVTMLPSRSEPSLENIETRNHLFGRLQEKNGKELPGLLQGQQIRVREPMTKTWIPGAIMQRSTQPRSYIVSTEKGQILRRNRQHIRSVPPQPMTPAARSVPPQLMTPAARSVPPPARSLSTLCGMI